MRPMHAVVTVLTALSVRNDVMTILDIMVRCIQNTLPLAQFNFHRKAGMDGAPTRSPVFL